MIINKTEINSFKYKTAIEVRFADMDLFGHVNNAVYLTYFEVARSNYWNQIIKWDWQKMGIIIARAEIDFKRPLKLNEPLTAYVKTSRIGTRSWDLEYVLTTEINGEKLIIATGKTVQVAIDYKLNKTSVIPEPEKQRMIDYEGL